ncbi:MAG TPA: hypothetical protein VNQ79_29225 [Blastocatellia bacterium]|nr:hypothetical protein [Blastocatellia bacterium]
MNWLPDLATENFDAISGEHSPRVCELVAVSWPQPDGTIWYCSTQADEIFSEPDTDFPVRPVEVRFSENQFLDLPIEDGISDSSIELDFWNGDGEIERLLFTHGEGVRVEVFYYFPDHALLVSQWHGHLGQPDESDGERFKVTAAYGFRSSMLPLPRRAFYTGCQAVFGGLLETQAEIDDGDCPYNRHLGGATGLLDANGQPFTSCPRHNRAACTARLGDDLSYLGFDTLIESYPNGKLLSTSRGNENNLKRPLRVVYGPYVVKDLDLLAFAVDRNTKHPDKGWVLCNFAVSEGVLEYLQDFKINNTYVGHEHQTVRTGERRQSRTFFTPNVNNYSGTALAVGRIRGNFENATGSDLQGEIRAGRKTSIRIYTAQEAWTEAATNNRAWVLLDAIRDKRWGHGIDPQRLVMQDWIDLAAWCDQSVTYLDAEGSAFTGLRSSFVGELTDKTAQRHIHDICLAGRFTTPFPHRGKTRIMALSKVDQPENAPVFTTEGDDRNICVDENGKPQLSVSRVTDKELPNRVVVTFNDRDYDNNERPLTFEDIPQQMRAGLAFGDNSRRVVEKRISLLGVDDFGQAVRLGNLLLDLGAFDGTDGEPGLQNNLSVTFTTWFTSALTLHKYKVIRLRVPRLERLSTILFGAPDGCDYWRISSFKRQSDLKVEIKAQLYPKAYYEQLESAEAAQLLRPGSGATDNPGGGWSGRPFPKGFASVSHDEDRIYFEVTA